MDQDKKLAFIAAMTDKALTHVAQTPNIAAPNGGMSHEKMLSFVTSMTKNGIQHFADGGTTLSGPTNPSNAPVSTGTSNTFLPSLNNPKDSAVSLANPINYLNGQNENLGIADIRSLIGGSPNTFQASAVPIQQGTNSDQLNAAYNRASGALGYQNALVGSTASGTSQGLNSQNYLSQQLTNQANGVGPNPAQSALNQQTGTNIAQQAALAAGQRGAGANAGLIAAQNAQQGAATQQQAVGQAATLQAQQQLAAQNSLQNLSSTQVNQGATAVQNFNQQAQNEQNILQGANTSFNNTAVQQQANLNNVNAGVSEANQAANKGLVGGILSGVSSAASLFAHGGMVKMDSGGKVLDANARAHIAPENFALAGGRYPIHDINHARNALARVSQNGSAEEKAKVRAAVKKKYPEIGRKKMASGGDVETPPFQPSPSNVSDGPTIPQTPAPAPSSDKKDDSGGGIGSLVGLLALLSEGGTVGDHYHTYFDGGDSGLMKNGGKVMAGHGQHAVVKGDSLKNDKIPAELSEGEIVIPRHITMGANAPAKAAAFVAAQLAKRGKK